MSYSHLINTFFITAFHCSTVHWKLTRCKQITYNTTTLGSSKALLH